MEDIIQKMLLIQKMLRLGVLSERETAYVELTTETFQSIEHLEYYGVSSDRKNLRGDITNIGKDLSIGVQKCKEEYELELV